MFDQNFQFVKTAIEIRLQALPGLNEGWSAQVLFNTFSPIFPSLLTKAPIGRKERLFIGQIKIIVKSSKAAIYFLFRE